LLTSQVSRFLFAVDPKLVEADGGTTFLAVMCVSTNKRFLKTAQPVLLRPPSVNSIVSLVVETNIRIACAQDVGVASSGPVRIRASTAATRLQNHLDRALSPVLRSPRLEALISSRGRSCATDSHVCARLEDPQAATSWLQARLVDRTAQQDLKWRMSSTLSKHLESLSRILYDITPSEMHISAVLSPMHTELSFIVAHDHLNPRGNTNSSTHQDSVVCLISAAHLLTLLELETVIGLESYKAIPSKSLSSDIVTWIVSELHKSAARIVHDEYLNWMRVQEDTECLRLQEELIAEERLADSGVKSTKSKPAAHKQRQPIQARVNRLQLSCKESTKNAEFTPSEDHPPVPADRRNTSETRQANEPSHADLDNEGWIFTTNPKSKTNHLRKSDRKRESGSSSPGRVSEPTIPLARNATLSSPPHAAVTGRPFSVLSNLDHTTMSTPIAPLSCSSVTSLGCSNVNGTVGNVDPTTARSHSSNFVGSQELGAASVSGGPCSHSLPPPPSIFSSEAEPATSHSCDSSTTTERPQSPCSEDNHIASSPSLCASPRVGSGHCYDTSCPEFVPSWCKSIVHGTEAAPKSSSSSGFQTRRQLRYRNARQRVLVVPMYIPVPYPVSAPYPRDVLDSGCL
jgi:hypothetical protein